MAPPSAIHVEAVTDTSAVTIPNPLAAPVKANDKFARSKDDMKNKGQWGVAAPSSSATFRRNYHGDKPKAAGWDHIISNEAKNRKGNSLKNAARFLSKPGIISLGGGLPSSDYFPFEELSLKVPAIGKFSPSESKESGVVITAGKHDLAQDKSIFDISTAFNYGQGSGSAQLLRWITEHTELIHNPPYQDWSCTMSIGSTSALDMSLRMLTRPGDMMLSEEYTFSVAVETATPLGIRVVGIPMDEQGLLPSSLDKILTEWDINSRGARKPHLLYTVPTGQNPTGATQSAARRAAVYTICTKHNIYILEDDPYYFLQMQPYNPSPSTPSSPPPSTIPDFLSCLVPSYLSLDTTGRVLRLDSFSKVLSPGTRIGWITAPEQIIQLYQKHADVSTQGPSGMAQLILYKLLDEHWGHIGFLTWLIHIRMQYTTRRDSILRACEKHLPKEIVSWVPPMAGMFHWMRVDFTQHPEYPGLGVGEIEERVFRRNIEEGALLMKGSWFYAEQDEEVERDTLFFRATYAAAPAERIEEAIRRFGVAVREEFGLKVEMVG